MAWEIAGNTNEQVRRKSSRVQKELLYLPLRDDILGVGAWIRESMKNVQICFTIFVMLSNFFNLILSL